MRVLVTDNFRPKPIFDYYPEWLTGIEPSLEIVKVSYLLNNLDEVNAVDGVLLTGGGDIHPQYYGRPEAIEIVEEVNEHRDEFEFKLVDRALERDLPIMAVCRGMQLLNVALGGSIIVDLRTAGYNDHRSPMDAPNVHPVHIDPHAMLYFAAGTPQVEINTLHHQALDKLGRGIKAVAISPDGVVEAVEWAHKDNMPFMLGVQWHPERHAGTELSRNIGMLFLKDVQRYALMTIGQNNILTAASKG